MMDMMQCSDGVCKSQYGRDELGRMTSVCSIHVAVSLTLMNPPPRIPRFEAGWDACEKVWAAWLDSEAAKRRQREIEEVERLRNEVIEFAKGLK